MVEGGVRVIKYAIFCFNFLFWISGISVIAVGAVAQSRLTPYHLFLDGKFWSPPILLIIVGCFITMIAFFGCCGAIKENHCMTMTFAVLLGIILILELSAGIAAYVLRGDLNDVVEKQMRRGLQEDYNTTNYETYSKGWDKLQTDSHCCGVSNYTDWVHSNFTSNKTSYSVPTSCCKEFKETFAKPYLCGDGPTLDVKNVYAEGCYTVMKDDIEDNIVAVGGAGVGLAFLQLLGVIFSCCLARAIRYEYQTV